MTRLVLIDGHAILHRAFHALPSLTTTKGQLVNAVYGFCVTLFKVIEDLKPTHLIVCFDRPVPTFRQEIFIGYQAKRPKMDEGLVEQVERVHDVLSAMKIPIYERDGYEADDLIGTIVRKWEVRSGKLDEAVVVTGDRDLLQLVDDSTKVYLLTKGLSEAKLFGESEVEEKMGVKPSQIVDYKGLIGDQSDNYPGVSGIGPKTATSLLAKFKSLSGIYQHLKQIPETLREKLEQGKESARLSYKLAQIVKNAPIKLDLEKAQIENFNKEKTIEMFKELEFFSLIKRLIGKEAVEEKKKTTDNQLGLF